MSFRHSFKDLGVVYFTTRSDTPTIGHRQDVVLYYARDKLYNLVIAQFSNILANRLASLFTNENKKDVDLIDVHREILL